MTHVDCLSRERRLFVPGASIVCPGRADCLSREIKRLSVCPGRVDYLSRESRLFVPGGSTVCTGSVGGLSWEG